MKLTKILLRLALTLLVLLGLDSSSFAQKIVAVIPVGRFPQGIVVNPFTNRIYVANGSSLSITTPNSVSVIDGSSNQVIHQIVTGLDFQIGLGIDEFRQRIYVATLESKCWTARPTPRSLTLRWQTNRSRSP
jgi:DNA-binding beta-propeller fold protein YncE